MKIDITHTLLTTEIFFQMIRDTPSEFSFAKDPTGRTIITHRGARFFGVTAPMSNVGQRLEDMDRWELTAKSSRYQHPISFFADDTRQPEVARVLNDSYARANFQTIRNDSKDLPQSLWMPLTLHIAELHRAIDELKLNGVVLLTNIKGRALTSLVYRPFFEEANRMNSAYFCIRCCPRTLSRLPSTY
jgi:hypothetical protein